MIKCSKCGDDFEQTEYQLKKKSRWCKKCVAAYGRKWQQDNKDKVHGIDKRYYVSHREKRCAARNLARNKDKLNILNYYSNNTLSCNRCGYDTDVRALCIDHINGGGNKHRREIGDGNIYRWLKKNNYPAGFQVLCANCNLIKTFENHEVPGKSKV